MSVFDSSQEGEGSPSSTSVFEPRDLEQREKLNELTMCRTVHLFPNLPTTCDLCRSLSVGLTIQCG